MAFKTITIDMEAYEALRRHQHGGQSFSDVIKRHFAGRATGRTLAHAVASLGVRETTLDEADRLIEARAADRSGPLTHTSLI